jgi:hypothetical protein
MPRVKENSVSEHISTRQSEATRLPTLPYYPKRRRSKGNSVSEHLSTLRSEAAASNHSSIAQGTYGRNQIDQNLCRQPRSWANGTSTITRVLSLQHLRQAVVGGNSAGPAAPNRVRGAGRGRDHPPLRKGGKTAQRTRDASAACARPCFHHHAATEGLKITRRPSLNRHRCDSLEQCRIIVKSGYAGYPIARCKSTCCKKMDQQPISDGLYRLRHRKV